MVSKKILTLGLALTLLSPLASYAGMGAESGGGGDAVIVNGEVVMRDMVLPNNITKIKNNLEFMNAVPHFREMISKIAKVRPYFAARIIGELSGVTLYRSPSKLPVLPYSETTISGKAADLQLATRVNDEIIFAPEFFSYPQAEFVLLHEALHGLLDENSGPVHHQRVRTIVKYIFDNLDNLDSDSLSSVLTENNFRDDSNDIYPVLWNEEESDLLRCFVYNQSTRSINTFSLGDYFLKYENLKCAKGDYNTVDEHAVKLVGEKFPEIISMQKKENIELRDYLYAPYMQTFTLEKDSIFKKRIKENQIRYCKENESTANETREVLKKIEKRADFFSKVENVLSDKNVSRFEKLALLVVISETPHWYVINTIEELQEKVIKPKQEVVQVRKEEVLKNLEILKEQSIACKKQYPSI